MDDTLEPKDTEVRLEQPESTELGITVTASGKTTSVKAVQFSNAPDPMVTILSGMVKLSLEHPLKADCPMAVTPEGKVMDSKAVHLLNVYEGSLVRPSGSVTLVSEVQFWNIVVPNEVTWLPITIDESDVQ